MEGNRACDIYSGHNTLCHLPYMSGGLNKQGFVKDNVQLDMGTSSQFLRVDFHGMFIECLICIQRPK